MKRTESVIPTSTKGTASTNAVGKLWGGGWVLFFFGVIMQNDLSCLSRNHSWWWGLGLWGYQFQQPSPQIGEDHSSVWLPDWYNVFHGRWWHCNCSKSEMQGQPSTRCVYVRNLVYLHFINSLITSLHVCAWAWISVCLGALVCGGQRSPLGVISPLAVPTLFFWGKNAHWLEACQLGWTGSPLSPQRSTCLPTFWGSFKVLVLRRQACYVRTHHIAPVPPESHWRKWLWGSY